MAKWINSMLSVVDGCLQASEQGIYDTSKELDRIALNYLEAILKATRG